MKNIVLILKSCEFYLFAMPCLSLFLDTSFCNFNFKHWKPWLLSKFELLNLGWKNLNQSSLHDCNSCSSVFLASDEPRWLYFNSQRCIKTLLQICMKGRMQGRKCKTCIRKWVNWARNKHSFFTSCFIAVIFHRN